MLAFPKYTVYADNLYYEPFVDRDGRVGYRCATNIEGVEQKETFIYFNPSFDGGMDANVFVYEGIENDPAEDNPIIFIKPEGILP